jgi:hypothetical protein
MERFRLTAPQRRALIPEIAELRERADTLQRFLDVLEAGGDAAGGGLPQAETPGNGDSPRPDSRAPEARHQARGPANDDRRSTRARGGGRPTVDVVDEILRSAPAVWTLREIADAVTNAGILTRSLAPRSVIRGVLAVFARRAAS